MDQFFTQWVYGADAPKFDLTMRMTRKTQIVLKVKQTQNGRPGGTVPRTDRHRAHHSTGTKGIKYVIEGKKRCPARGQRAVDGAV